MKSLTLLFLALLASAGCNGGERNELRQNEANPNMVKYPYKAGKERLAQIDRGVKQVHKGASSDEVVRLMGNPDEVNDTLDKNDWDKKVGFSFVYIKQRDRASGSVREKNEDLIRIHFNQKKEVTRIDRVTSASE